jgi:hypothetical protein
MAATNATGATPPAPATPVPGAPPVSSLPAPVTATDWAYAILLGLGINPNANNGAPLTALIAQMSVEDPTLTYLTSKNNPLAISNGGGTVIPGNPDGVEEYSSWLTGLAGTIADIKANPAMLSALQSGSSCQQYGGAVSASNWEGGGAGQVNNPGYGAAVASRCNNPAVQSNTASPAFGQALANSNLGPDIISELGNPALSAETGALSATESVADFLGDLTNPTKLRRVEVFALGAAIFIIGILGFLSTTKEGQKVVSQGEGAAKIAALA